MLSQNKTEPKETKIMDEGAAFNEKWTDEYFFVETNNMALCLICKEIMSVFKDYNLKRCYLQKHAAKFNVYQGMLHKERSGTEKGLISTKYFLKSENTNGLCYRS